MNRRTVFACILSLLMLVGSFVPAAMAEIFQRTILMGPGAGQFAIGDLGVGDTVVLTLVNPTNQPLTFETTQNIANQKNWTVAPNSQQTVEFTYTKPFDDDVEFAITSAGGPTPIAQGTLIPRGGGMAVQPSVMERPAARPVGPAPMVRGFW